MRTGWVKQIWSNSVKPKAVIRGVPPVDKIHPLKSFNPGVGKFEEGEVGK